MANRIVFLSDRPSRRHLDLLVVVCADNRNVRRLVSVGKRKPQNFVAWIYRRHDECAGKVFRFLLGGFLDVRNGLSR